MRQIGQKMQQYYQEMDVAPEKKVERLPKNLINGTQKASFWLCSKEGRESLIVIALVIHFF